MGAVNMSGKMPWRREFANDWPCKRDCPDRKVGCHAICERYAVAKVKHDAVKAKLLAKRHAAGAVNEYIVKQMCETTGKPLKQR